MEVRGEAAMAEEAARFAASLVQDERSARVVALSGDLGAGKTTFVRGIARYFGVEEQITSPTFTIEQAYALPRGPFKKLVHIDAYRIEDVRELEPLRFEEMCADRDALVLIEWPERLAQALPEGARRISLVYRDEGAREITYE